MTQRVVLETQAGKMEYAVFGDNVALAMAYRDREVFMGDNVLYRGLICEIIGEHEDEEGFVWPDLLLIAPLQSMPIKIVM